MRRGFRQLVDDDNRRVSNGFLVVVADTAAISVSMLWPQGLDSDCVDFSFITSDPPTHS